MGAIVLVMTDENPKGRKLVNPRKYGLKQGKLKPLLLTLERFHDIVISVKTLPFSVKYRENMSKVAVQAGFKVGDLVVYPAHGVGIIVSIDSKSLSGMDLDFYVMKVIDSDATIMVPVDNAETVGLRRVVKKSVVPKVYDILKDRTESIIESQTWNKRYRNYTDKIRTGCVMEVAKVLRDLYLLKVDKELSFGERRMLDTAKNLLIKELSIAKNIKEEKVAEELDRIMKSN